MNIHFRNRWLVLTVLLSFIVTIGCGSSHEGHDEHGEEHADHEHLEHFVPAHKPKDFAELVDQLALRFPQLGSAGAGDEHRTARQELADIIGWIPELAADSELKKTDFETAVATVNRFSKALEETAASAGATSGDAAGFEPLIEELRQLVPKSEVQADPM